MTLLTHLQGLDEDSLVLASTERVARHLKMQAALLQSVAGKRSWFAKGKICTVPQWIEQSWLDLLPSQQLLYPVQELAVVKNVADKSGLLPDTLISSTSTARRISQAYSQFVKFQLPDDPDHFRFKREYEVFWQWRKLIQEDCAANGYVFRADLPGLIHSAIQAGAVTLPRKIVLVGVLYMNPSERAVFELLRSLGTEVIELEIEKSVSAPHLVRAVTQADEFDHVAEWVNATLMPYIDTPHAAPTIALLVPDMNAYQAPMIEALTLTVSPASLMPPVGGVEAREPWDVSSGATLGSRPMIRAAMDILSITARAADADTFSRVLRSSWVGGADTEGATRALVDVWLRENSGLNMRGADYLRALTACKTSCENFINRFMRLIDAHDAATEKRYPSEWCEFFAASLSLMGWPNAESLSSANYQTLDAWSDAQAVFRSLDYQLGPCNYERAYMWLREIITTRQFQPRLGHVAPVAIMSYQDAVGLQFDHVWVIGATNKVLPLPADPNPFLPVELLAAAGVPEATGEGQLSKAQKVVAALMGCSESLTFSCHETDDRGSNVGASELLGPWPEAKRNGQVWLGFEGNTVGALNREVYEEETVPPVSDDELKLLTGGVSVFTNYANEPFFAFACNRLRATPFPKPIVGFDPRIQGTMLHLCLELFWKEVRSQGALKAMTPEQLAAKVSSVIELASYQLLYKLEWRYGRRMIRLEQSRLAALVLEWMDYEMGRKLPFVVVAFEAKTEVDVYGVPLTVTLDRTDIVTADDGREFHLLIDYKSGANFKFNSLNATSLREPQLPIYATSVEPGKLNIPSIDGITLAQVNAKKMSLHTRSSFSGDLIHDKVGKNDVGTQLAWDAQVAGWGSALTEMAHGILSGYGVLSDTSKALPVGFEHLEPVIR